MMTGVKSQAIVNQPWRRQESKTERKEGRKERRRDARKAGREE